eukprot:scaffold1813_cov109-Cylindrotheca_fusiformis.AAC.11
MRAAGYVAVLLLGVLCPKTAAYERSAILPQNQQMNSRRAARTNLWVGLSDMENDEQDKTDYIITLENSYGRQLDPWQYLAFDLKFGIVVDKVKDKKAWIVTMQPEGDRLRFSLKAKKKIDHGRVLITPSSGRWRTMGITNTEFDVETFPLWVASIQVGSGMMAPGPDVEQTKTWKKGETVMEVSVRDTTEYLQKMAEWNMEE